MRRSLTQLTVLLLVLQGSGCGLGTEVGNGSKPKDEDDDDPKTASEDTNAPPLEEGQDGGGGDYAQNDDKDQGGEGVSSGSDGSDGSGGNVGSPNVGIVPEGFTINPALLVTACASPFSEDYGSNYELITPPDETGSDPTNQMFATRAQDGSWEITTADEKLLYTVAKKQDAGALAVSAKDGEGKDANYGFKCTGVTSETDVAVDGGTGTYSANSVYVGAGSLKAKVTWYFKPVDGATKAELFRIAIDDVDGEEDPVLLNATAVQDE